jgi:hypothetical protein
MLQVAKAVYFAILGVMSVILVVTSFALLGGAEPYQGRLNGAWVVSLDRRPGGWVSRTRWVDRDDAWIGVWRPDRNAADVVVIFRDGTDRYNELFTYWGVRSVPSFPDEVWDFRGHRPQHYNTWKAWQSAAPPSWSWESFRAVSAAVAAQPGWASPSETALSTIDFAEWRGEDHSTPVEGARYKTVFGVALPVSWAVLGLVGSRMLAGRSPSSN